MDLEREKENIRNPNLYLLSKELEAVEEGMLLHGGEITDDVANRLDQLEAQLETKLEKIVALLANMGAQVAGMKDEEARIARKRKARERAMRSLRSWVALAMVTADRKTINLTSHTLTVTLTEWGEAKLTIR